MQDSDWNEYEVIEIGRRLGIRRPGWMIDYFNSWSPRNDNSNAEGPWHEWVEMAVAILAHPATTAIKDRNPPYLTEDEVKEWFSDVG